MNHRRFLIPLWTAVSLLFLLAASLPHAAGSNWAPQSSGTTNHLRSVHFINASEGWAAGANATLLHTSNGGRTWSAVTNTTINTSRGFNTVRFFDQNVGWVGGFQSIIRTLNGGATWAGTQYASDDDYSRHGLFPLSSTVAWQVGMENFCYPCYPVYIRFTRELDVNYTHSLIHVGGPSSFSMTDVCFIDPDNGWSVGASLSFNSPNSIIVRITKGSESSPEFTVQASGFSVRLKKIQMLDALNGWVVGEEGAILRTVDGGDTWTPQASGTTANLNGVYFLNLNEGWVVGAGGLLLSTLDGGQNWMPESSGTTEDLNNIFFIGSKGYAVGANGTILANETETRTYLPLILR